MSVGTEPCISSNPINVVTIFPIDHYYVAKLYGGTENIQMQQ